MKHALKFLLLIAFIVLTIYAFSQTNGMNKPIYRNTLPSQQQMARPIQQVAKIVPIPNKINFTTFTKQFTSSPNKKVNSFAKSASLNKLTINPANNQALAANNGSKNIMDNTRPGPGSIGRPNSMTTSIRTSAAATAISPSITKKTADGSSVTYFLKQSSQISDWGDGSKVKANVASQSPTQYNPTNKMNCHTTILSFNARSTSFMNAQPEMQGSNLIPGMIFDFADLSKGNFNQQRYNFNRSPIGLTSDVYGANGSISADVPDPNRESINNGLQSIIKNFAGTPGGSTVQMQITKTENTAEQSLLIAGGGSYGAFSGKASFQQNSSTYHLYYTIDAVKPLFTVGVVPKSTSFYNPGANVDNTGFPVMIQDVTFGARVLANMDIAVSSETDAGDISFNYNDGMESAWGQFKAAIGSKNVSVSINGYLIGFPAKFPGSFSSNPDDFLNMLTTFFNGCDYASAKPVQYALMNLDGDYMGIESITDKATIQECTPANENFKLQSATVILQTGNDDKNSNSEFWLSLASGDPLHPNWIGQFYDNHSEFKRDGNPYQISIPINSNIMFSDFNSNGGFIALKLIEHNGGNDDWDFQNMDIVLNFMSESGTPKSAKISLGGFKIHDTKNSKYDSKQIQFMSDLKGGFAPKQ